MSLKTRTITGLSFGAVMIGACVYSPYSCSLLFLLISGLCLWELGTHVLLQDGTSGANMRRQVFYLAVGLFLPLWSALNYVWGIEVQNYLFVLPALLFSGFLIELFGKSAKPFNNLGFTFLGIIYIGLPFALLMWICSAPYAAFGESGHHVILASLFMVWASDVFAYLLGSKIGKTKMFPRISPNKTWEGTLSGVTGAILVGYLCSLLFSSLSFSLVFWIGMATICTVFGILGDLVESMLKRSLGIKDSGNLLPGHGGFLDRFDAFIFVVPFLFTYIFICFEVW